MPRSKLVHEVRLGQVRATVWEESRPEGMKHSVALHRMSRIDNHWLPVERFEPEDLPILAEALDLAHLWICEQEVLIG
ncbi:MAG: hypothetical protein SFX18_13040 [Pirellulales bacterium]|nr:hypothetical protein [Pirellulales bacterium]